MPGGGSMRTGSGQVTDDSEMAMCLLHALGRGGRAFTENILSVSKCSVENNEISKLNLERI